MNKEVFKGSFLTSIILPAFITLLFLFFYFDSGDMPAWTLFFLLIPIVIAIDGQKTRLIVKDDNLFYHHGILFKGSEEISLKYVSEIVTSKVETWDRGSDGTPTRATQKVTFVLDSSGKQVFTFPARLIGLGNKQRFIETVTAINPTIRIG